MKKIILILCLLPILAFSQVSYKIIADSTILKSISTNSNELVIRNSTKDTTTSVLYNNGNGVTQFKKVRNIRLNDSTYVIKIGTTVIGDTLKIKSTSNGSNTYAGNGLTKYVDTIKLGGRTTQSQTIVSVGSPINNPIGGVATIWTDTPTRPTVSIECISDDFSFLTGYECVNFNTLDIEAAQIGSFDYNSSSDLDDNKLMFLNNNGSKETYLIGLPTDDNADQIVVRDSATNRLYIANSQRLVEKYGVTSVSAGYGTTFTTITSSGSVIVDTADIASKTYLASSIAVKANQSALQDTASALNTRINAKQASGSYAVTTNNLSDLASASTARTNLGLGTAAVQNTSAFLQPSNNLSDVSSASTARSNLGLGTASTQATGAFFQISNNLSDGTASTMRTNLGATTIGVSMFTLTNPSAVTFPRYNADNTVTARTAAQLKSDLAISISDLSGLGTNVATNLAQTRAFQTLTDGATVTYNVSSGYNAKVTLGGNRTLSITNAAAGDYGTLIVIQDGTGSRTLTLPGSSKVINGGSGAITLTTTASATDILSWFYDGTNYFWTYGKNYN